MNLNLYIISDYLEHPPLYTSIKGSYTQCSLCNVTLYDSSRPLIPGWLYLMDFSDFIQANHLTNDAEYIIYGWKQEYISNIPVSYIGITDKKNLLETLWELQQIFERFRQWELQLYQLVSENAVLREYGAVTLSFLENPIAMYTAGLRNVFFCERKKPEALMLFHEKDVDAFLPYEEIEALRLLPDFIETIDTTDPQIFPKDFWGYRILYHNIRINNIYIARIMVCEVERPIRRSDYAILQHLSFMLRQGLERQGLAINNHPKDFDNYLFQLIDRKPVPDTLLVPIIENYKWKADDTYFCVRIPISTYDQAISTVNTFCTRLESSIRGSAALIRGEYIILIVNLRLSSAGREDILSNLIYMLRESLLKAGISMEFSDLFSLCYYYDQAENALKLGQSIDPTLWYYRYENYAYRHLLKKAAGDATIESICPDSLTRLITYDQKHNRQYTRSLKVYLEQNMSVTKAIRILYIQRSTFIYQLKRIHEISGLNLTQKDIRIHLLLVFQIMDEEGYELP